MNERQLESFILSADEKSFSKAANKSYISTPALVQQINLLEKSIGFQLFHRNHQGITLTPAGKLFYQYTQEILKLYHEACKKGQELENHLQVIKVAYPFEKFPPFLLKAYQQFHQQYPHIQLDFIPLSFNQHIQSIQNKTVDLSIIARPQASLINGLKFDSITQDTYSFCMSPSHPLAHKDLLTLEDLKPYPILIGQYSYLDQPLNKVFPSSYKTIQLKHAYDLNTCSNLLVSNEIIIIHSLWKENYTSLLKVVPSCIPAGDIGVVYHPGNHILDLFLSYLKTIVI